METCGMGRGGIGGGAGGGGGGGGGVGAGATAAGIGGGGFISSAHAVSNSTNETLANFALVVSFMVFMDLRYAQGYLGA
jgi:hypothetical protein